MKSLTVSFTSWSNNHSIASRWKSNEYEFDSARHGKACHLSHRIDGPAYTVTRMHKNYTRREWWNLGRCLTKHENHNTKD